MEKSIIILYALNRLKIITSVQTVILTSLNYKLREFPKQLNVHNFARLAISKFREKRNLCGMNCFDGVDTTSTIRIPVENAK